MMSRIEDTRGKPNGPVGKALSSTLAEFSNFKNSLNSIGNRIVAIHDLPKELERRQPFLWRACLPVSSGVVVVERADAEKGSIQTEFVLFHVVERAGRPSRTITLPKKEPRWQSAAV